MTTQTGSVSVIDHPLVAAKLTVARKTSTPPAEFRRNIQELSILLLAEASRGRGTAAVEIQTPLTSCTGVVVARAVVFVPILRAGLGMLDGMLQIVPEAQVGH